MEGYARRPTCAHALVSVASVGADSQPQAGIREDADMREDGGRAVAAGE